MGKRGWHVAVRLRAGACLLKQTTKLHELRKEKLDYCGKQLPMHTSCTGVLRRPVFVWYLG